MCTAAILKQPRHGSKTKVYKQIIGQRRSGIWTQWNISHEKKSKTKAQAAPQMSLEIITQREVSQNVKDKCPRISLMSSDYV